LLRPGLSRRELLTERQWQTAGEHLHVRSDPGIFGANPGDAFSYISDIHGVSHEVQEWYDDPFVNNIVSPWLTPTAPQYGAPLIWKQATLSLVLALWLP